MARNVSKEYEEMMKKMNSTAENSTHDHVKSMLAHLKKFLHNITHYDIHGIENEVLPHWNTTWKDECPKMIKEIETGKLGDKIVKTVEGCPFYRGLVKRLSSYNMSQMVSRMHRNLTECNISKSLDFARECQDKVRKDINATSCSDSVHRVVHRMQEGVPADVEANSAEESREVAAHIIHELQEEVRSHYNVTCDA